MAKVTFDTSSYLRSHGKAPRGLGFWAFEISGIAAREFEASGIKLPNITVERCATGMRGIIHVYGGQRSLAEAKKMVRELFRLGAPGQASFVVQVAP